MRLPALRPHQQRICCEAKKLLANAHEPSLDQNRCGGQGQCGVRGKKFCPLFFVVRTQSFLDSELKTFRRPESF